jgi:acyl carrier protein
MRDTYDKVVDLLVTRFDIDRDRIRPGVTFDELEMDSLFLVEFLLIVRSEFGAPVSEDAATPQDTIERAVQLIDEQLVRAPGS